MTLQQKNKACGYFAGGRFGSKDGAEITDEITQNPAHFKSRTDEQSLSTFAHEMAHLTVSASYRAPRITTGNGPEKCTRSGCTLPIPAGGMNAWGKPGVRLVCGECDEPMVAEEPDGG